MSITIEFFIFELVYLSTNFQLKLTIAIFWTKFAPKKVAIFSLKQIKYTPQLSFAYSNFTLNNFEFLAPICPRKILVLVPNFSLNWQFWFFGPKWPKKVFPVKNWKSERHWNPHIQISLGTKFLLKLKILIFFWQYLPKKDFSGLKQKKWTPHVFYIILHI